MGALTDARIKQWQERAGLEPAQGQRLETLRRMGDLAVDLIRIIELERAGIRDGDGWWHGSDPLDGTIQLLVEAHDDHEDPAPRKSATHDAAGAATGRRRRCE